MPNNPTLQNVKSTRNKGMEMCYIDSVSHELDFYQICRNLPDVVCGGDYGHALPVKMFHKTFEQFFHLSIGAFSGK